MGVDVGQAHDPSAIAIVEQLIGYADANGNEDYLDIDQQQYTIRWLERIKLRTPYPAMVKIVKDRRDQLDNCTVAVDSTGVGRPIVDLLREAGLTPVAITITSGEHVTSDDEFNYRVPKRDLVMAVQLLQQQQRLKVSKGLAEGPAFANEMQNFKYKISLAGNDSYNAWRESDHDDMVLAAACALWLAAYKPATGQSAGSLAIFGVPRQW